MAPCDWQGNLRNADNGAAVGGGGGVGGVSVDRLHGGEVGLYFIRYKRFLECDRNRPCESPSGQAAASRAKFPAALQSSVSRRLPPRRPHLRLKVPRLAFRSSRQCREIRRVGISVVQVVLTEQGVVEATCSWRCFTSRGIRRHFLFEEEEKEVEEDLYWPNSGAIWIIKAAKKNCVVQEELRIRSKSVVMKWETIHKSA